MKKISIIIPVYNTAKYLKRCFDSVLVQSYKDFEMVIINDGSTDNSEQIINEYKDKYPDLISYYNKPNTGVASTRNFGIEKANGEYIMFLDSDDYIDKALLKTLEQYINKDIDLIKFKLQRVDEEGKTLEIVPGATFEETTGEDGFNKLYSTDVLLDSPCVYLIKKEIFTQNNLKFAVGTEHEDFGLIPFIIVLAKTMVSVNFYGYFYIQSDNSITRNEDYKRTIKKAYDALKHYDNAIELTKKLNLNKLTKQNIRIYYTNAIILKAKELHDEEQEKYIKVSIIVPFYNVEEYIERSIKSLVEQSLEDIEIILVNDGSKDGSEEIAKEYKRKYPDKIVYLEKENGGLSDARNYALPYATGEYIAFLDSDDYVEEEMYEEMYVTAKIDKADIVECDYLWEYPEETIESKGRAYKDRKDMLLNARVVAWNKLIKKEIARNIKFQNYDECQDEIFILSCYSKANKISFINEQLYYKYEDNSNKNLKNQVQIKDLKDGLVEVKKLYKDAGKYEKLKNMLTFIAFTRIGMRALIELTVTKNGDLKDNIRDVMNYLDINFFEWRKNPFLKLKNVPRKKYWIAYTMYKYGFQQLFIKIYSKPIEKGNKLLII